MDLGLKGRTVLITGASQGIGAGVAEVFAEEGCDLHLTARNAENLDAVRGALVARFPVKITLHPCDLTKAGAPEALAGLISGLMLMGSARQ